MKKCWLPGVLASCLLWPTLVFAQLPATAPFPTGPIPIKGHPQRTVYNSPSEWPKYDGQAHWCGDKTGPAEPCSGTDPHRMTHLHAGCTFPTYGEIDGPVRFRCDLQGFRGAAKITRLDFGGIRRDDNASLAAVYDSVIWEATKTKEAPPLVFDPAGLKVWSFWVTLRPEWLPIKHGPSMFVVSLEAKFDNGDDLHIQFHNPFWAALDRKAPVKSFADPCDTRDGNYPFWPFTVDISSHSARGDTPDSQIIRVCSFLPLPGVPITAPMKLHHENGRYGSGAKTKTTPKGFSEMRAGLNLHQFHEGVEIDRVESPNGWEGPIVTVRDSVIEPSQLKPGAQNCVIRWGMRLEKTPKTPTLAGGEDVQALVTFPCWGPAGAPALTEAPHTGRILTPFPSEAIVSVDADAASRSVASPAAPNACCVHRDDARARRRVRLAGLEAGRAGADAGAASAAGAARPHR
jgi:hypothetical protein